MPDLLIGFVKEECYSCSMIFFVTTEFQKKRIADKENIFCPNGHAMVYRGKTKEQELREQLNAKNVELNHIQTELLVLKKKKTRKKKTT